MSRVGEKHRLEAGRERPSTGFLSGAASLLGLRRLFVRDEAFGSVPVPASGPLPLCAAPAFQPGETPGRDAVSRRAPVEEPAAGQDEAERLAAHIAAAGAAGRVRRVLITHSSPSEAPLAGLDCAAFASHLARCLAFEGRTILVVFGAGGGMRPGLSELIDGSASFSEAIHREAGSRLHILPSGHGRVVAGGDLNVVLDALSDTYDFVVLSATDEDRDALRRLSIMLAPRADHVLIGCPGQIGSPDMVALRDALKDEGAGEVIAARIGATHIDAREAA